MVLPAPPSLPHLCFHHDFSLCAGKMQAPFRSFRRKCPAFVPTGEYGKKGVPACGLTLLLFMFHPLLEVLLENLRFRNSYPVDFANWKKIQVCLLWLSYPMEGAPSTGHIRRGLPPMRRWKPCWKRFRMAAYRPHCGGAKDVQRLTCRPILPPAGRSSADGGGCLDSITQATSVPCTIQEKETEIWERHTISKISINHQ